MRASIAALAVALLVCGALTWGLRRLSIERTDLARRVSELSARAEARRGTGERDRRLGELLRTGSQTMGGADRELDIAELRDLLLGAERGLDIDRFSLDFRPAQDAPKSREGGRVRANLGGSFDAVHEYLGRVEELRLPLALEALSLGADDSGRILLGIEWDGVWSGKNAALDQLPSSEVARLERWLAREPAPRPGRNSFSDREVPEEISPPRELSRPSPAPEPATAGHEPLISSGAPELTGFVIARPELETDVNRRVLAALRFEGELRLLGVGEAIGSYRVEEIEPRDSVVLVNQESGERLKLFLE